MLNNNLPITTSTTRRMVAKFENVNLTCTLHAVVIVEKRTLKLAMTEKLI